MNQQYETGLFGKLPAHGDFVQRNLPAGFINIWDEWLQHFIAGTKEILGNDWLDIYLTSPIWRFVFSSGVIDENVWTGIMIPSVDRVGRYYPFSIIRKLPDDVNPFDCIHYYKNWYEEIEMLSLDALDDQILIDELVLSIEKSESCIHSVYVKNNYKQDKCGFQIDMDFEEQSPISVYSSMLDAFTKTTFQSYSIWQTTGSNLINPCLCVSQGLPDIKKSSAMLKGDWQNNDWHQPYILNDIEKSREIA